MTRTLLVFCLLLFAIGVDPASAASIDAAPNSASPGSTFMANAEGLTDGSTYRIYLERGNPYVERFLLSEFTATDVEATRKLAVPAGAQQQAHHLVLYLGTTIMAERARTPFTVGTPLAVTLFPATAAPGKSVRVTVDGNHAGAISIDYAGARILGPVAVGDGRYVGKFIVPKDRPASIPGTAVVTATNLVGKFVAARGSVNFAVQAPSGLPTFRSSFSAAPPANAAEGTRLNFSGRVQQPDGSGSSGRTSFFWRGTNGQVVPIDGGVSAAADGTYTLKARAPSFFMDGVSTFGSGEIIGSVSDDDPETGGQRDFGFVTNHQLVNEEGFTPIDGQFVIKLRGPGVVQGGPPQLIQGAYVEVLGGYDEAFSDPHDGIPPAGSEDILLGENQMSQAQIANGSQQALGSSGCPITFARKFTDNAGEAVFEFDGEKLRSLLVLQAATALGEIRTVNVGVPIPGEDVFDQVGNPQNKGGDSGDVVYITLVVVAGQQGFGETGQIDDDANPNTPTVLGYAPTYIGLSIDIGNGDVTVESGPQFGGSAAESNGIVAVELPRIPLFNDAVKPNELRIAGLSKPTPDGMYMKFSGMHSFPNTQLWPDSVFNPRNAGREIRFGWEAGFGAVQNASLYLKLPGDSALRYYSAFALEGNSACNLAGVSDYVASLPDLTRLPVPDQIAQCFTGKIEVDRPGPTASQHFKFCTTNPPPGMNVQNSQLDLATFRIDARTTKYSGNLKMPTQNQTVSRAEMAEYEIPPQQNASANEGGFAKSLNSAGYVVDDIDTATGHIIGNNDTRETLNSATLFGFDPNTQSAGNVEETTVLDTGRIPLFRYPWGFSPIAGAILGADFWLGSDIAFYGTLAGTSGSGNLVDATVDPTMEGGVDMFFDLDILFGVISASVTAKPTLGLILRDAIGKGGLYNANNSNSQVHQSGLCYGFDVDVEMEICVVFCGSDEFNLFNVSEPAGCYNALRADEKDAGDLARGGFDLAKPRLLPSALAVDGFGRQLVVQVDAGNRLVASHLAGTRAEAERVIDPVANGIQHIDVVYTSGNRAIAVWSENSLTPAALQALMHNGPNAIRGSADDIARAQVLRFSVYDGTRWSGPARVDPAQDGSVGKPRLAACKYSFIALDGCLRGGAAYLVWEYDANENIAAPDLEIWGTSYTPSSGFGSAVRLSTATGTGDMQPDVAYMGGTPVVAWISNTGAHYGNPSSRQVAYRVIDRTTGQPTFGVQSLRTTSGAGWPSIAALDRDEIVLAYTRAQDASIVGNRNALTVAKGLCVDGLCSFEITEPRDPAGRQFRGERPVVALADGEVVISFRGLAYGPDAAGNTGHPNDSPGMLLGSGEHLALRLSDFSAPRAEVAVQPLSANGLQHWRPDFAFDPALDAFVGISQQAQNPTQQFRALEFARRYAEKGFTAVAQGKAVGDAGVMLTTLAPTPDFRIDALTLPAAYLTASTSVNYTVTIRNAGAAYDPAVHGIATLVLAWDAPPGVGVAAAAPFALSAAMGANAKITLVRPAGVPAAHNSDERRTLYVEIRPAAAMEDANAADNVADVTVGAMPVPQDLLAQIKTNSPVIGLDWTPATDPRVVGYRVYKRAENGKFVPYGSSQVSGYADLFAGFRNVEHYRVTSYSARGIESEMSDVVVAVPATSDGLFGNGFEASQ